MAEMTKVNPNFRDDYGLDNTTLTTELFEARDALEKRQAVVSEFSHKCFDPWGPADRDEIRKGIDYLYKVNGRPKNGPGPGNCGRVSCSNNAAIWWCNDVSLRVLCSRSVSLSPHFILFPFGLLPLLILSMPQLMTNNYSFALGPHHQDPVLLCQHRQWRLEDSPELPAISRGHLLLLCYWWPSIPPNQLECHSTG